MIGIVGGVGPYAGLDLAKKIFDQTIAFSDQDHLPVVMISESAKIEDRTKFLLRQAPKNPGFTIAQVIKKLHQIGATVVGIPCNTAHSPEIFNVILHHLEKENVKIKLLNMITETVYYLKNNFPKVKNVGLLSTLGTYKTNIYSNCFETFDLNVIIPDKSNRVNIHSAIYDPIFGIKSKSNPVTEKARTILLNEIYNLQNCKAEAVILGCTEIPLAIEKQKVGNCMIIDPTLILARSLINYVSPKKLKN